MTATGIPPRPTAGPDAAGTVRTAAARTAAARSGTGPVTSFSDTVAGYVEHLRGDRLLVRTLGDDPVTLELTPATSAQRLRNLGEPHQDVTGRMAEFLVPGALVFSYGPLYYGSPEGPRFQVDHIVVAGGPDTPLPGDAPGWWTGQLRRLAAFYRRSQFGDGPADFGQYRTELRGGGEKPAYGVQETDTISRLVYGMATTYLLTGEEEYLDIAERGCAYLHDHLRFHDPAEDVVYWYHGIEKHPLGERKLFASEFGDEHRSLPAYEQIYALVGLAQTYRITGDPVIRADIDGTVRLFERFYADPRLGGYYSHIDPVTFSPHADTLGPNRSRKNWNSTGDHAPAYLINLYLATGDERHLRMLEHAFDMIVEHMPDRGGPGPFVNERFHADWTPDHAWGWQQNHAVVGHNLKIVWNLLRMQWTRPKREYRALAEELGARLPAIARDAQRGGWYDLMERVPRDGRHAFARHDRKTWWQQEQAILAYLLLAAHTGDTGHLRHAREAAAFYNAFFLDHDAGAVHFTVLAQGIPYAVGNERLKGSHAMSMYHKAELCYLAETYQRLLIHGEPLELWFKPRPDAALPGRRVLRVAPDLLPPGKVHLDRVLVDGEPWTDFDADAMAVRLPDTAGRPTVRVRLRPGPAPVRKGTGR